MDVKKVGQTVVKCIATGELCRLYSRRLSTLKPQLDAHGVRLVGVGLEELGVQEYVDGKFWAGELYVDTKKQGYKSMGYKKLGVFGAIGSILGKKGRDMISDAKKAGIDGDLKGDGYQNGGSFIVTKGGEQVLLNYIQESPADHVALDDVLKALGISAADAAASSEGASN